MVRDRRTRRPGRSHPYWLDDGDRVRPCWWAHDPRLQLALHAGPSLFFSTGLPATMVAHRVLAMTSGVSGDLLRHGRVSNRDWSHVSTAIRRIERMPRVDVVDRVTDLSHARAVLDGRDVVAEPPRTVVLDGIDLGTNLGFETRSMALHMIGELAEQHPAAWVVSVGLSSADYAPAYGGAFDAFLDGVPGWVDNVVWLDDEPRSTVRRVEVYNRNGSSGSIELARRTGVPRFYGATPLVDTANDLYGAAERFTAADFADQVEGIRESLEIDS